jgi:hypothetical protein
MYSVSQAALFTHLKCPQLNHMLMLDSTHGTPWCRTDDVSYMRKPVV